MPHNVAVALCVYSAITWLGMYFYGREMWLRHGEAFTVVFTLFAVFEVRVRNGKACRDCAIFDRRDDAGGCTNAYGAFFRAPPEARELNLRPPEVGLRGGAPPSASLVAFVLLLLATVTFDGFTETETWQANARAAFDALRAAGLGGEASAALVDLAGLVAFPLVFVVVYLAFVVLIGAASESVAHFAALAPLFVFSIVPIAIAYHLSHYISLLVVEGQLVFAGVSDPFGIGWNLFGTAAYRPDITAIGARFVWFFSVLAIVTGHIIVVWLAHREALDFYDRRQRALESQVPMLALMLGYTMVSLWIIAQPIVG